MFMMMTTIFVGAIGLAYIRRRQARKKQQHQPVA